MTAASGGDVIELVGALMGLVVAHGADLVKAKADMFGND